MKNLNNYFRERNDGGVSAFKSLLKSLLADMEARESKEATPEDLRELLTYHMHQYLLRTGNSPRALRAVRYINPMALIQMYLRIGSYLAEKEDTVPLNTLDQIYVFDTLKCQIVTINTKNIVSQDAICGYHYSQDLIDVLRAIRDLLNIVYPNKYLSGLLGDE